MSLIKKFEVRGSIDRQFYAVALGGNGKVVWLTETMRNEDDVHKIVRKTWEDMRDSSVEQTVSTGIGEMLETRLFPVPYTRKSLKPRKSQP